MSWSPTRETAAYYARRTRLEWGNTGEPVLLRREVTRDQVLAYFINQADKAGEAVVGGPGACVIDTADASEIAVLAAAAEPMIAKGEKRSERIKAEVMGMSEDELFAGWAG
jgi:hypothetical protein